MLKIISIFIYIIFLNVSYSYSSYNIDDICYKSQYYNNDINIIIFDGTTNPDDYNVNRFSNGIRSILMNNNIKGKIELYSIGPKDYTIKLIHDDCVPQYEVNSDNDNKSPVNYKGLKQKILDFIFPNPPSRDKFNDNNMLYSVTDKRNNIIKAIINKSIKSSCELKTSCLLNDFVSVVENRNDNYEIINIFFFTDLVDSQIKFILKQKISESELINLANKFGDKYKLESITQSSKKKTIFISFWGVGRNEYKKELTYKKEELDKLKIYWKAFLQKVFKDKFFIKDIRFNTDFSQNFS